MHNDLNPYPGLPVHSGKREGMVIASIAMFDPLGYRGGACLGVLDGLI